MNPRQNTHAQLSFAFAGEGPAPKRRRLRKKDRTVARMARASPKTRLPSQARKNQRFEDFDRGLAPHPADLGYAENDRPYWYGLNGAARVRAMAHDLDKY